MLSPCNVDTAGPLPSAQTRETIRSTPSHPLLPHSFPPLPPSHFLSRAPPWPKLPSHIAVAWELLEQIQAHKKVHRVALSILIQGIDAGGCESSWPSSLSSSPAAALRASSRVPRTSIHHHFCAIELPSSRSLSLASSFCLGTAGAADAVAAVIPCRASSLCSCRGIRRQAVPVRSPAWAASWASPCTARPKSSQIQPTDSFL